MWSKEKVCADDRVQIETLMLEKKFDITYRDGLIIRPSNSIPK